MGGTFALDKPEHKAKKWHVGVSKVIPRVHAGTLLCGAGEVCRVSSGAASPKTGAYDTVQRTGS